MRAAVAHGVARRPARLAARRSTYVAWLGDACGCRYAQSDSSLGAGAQLADEIVKFHSAPADDAAAAVKRGE